MKRRDILKAAASILLIAIIGFSTVKNYGVSSDEEVEILMVNWNLELITKGKPIPSNLRYYGTVFNFSAEAAFRAYQLIQQFLGNWREPNGPPHYVKRWLFQKRIEVKHVWTFAFALIAYACVAGITGILAGPQYAWIGPLLMALFPRFWGHSFFNPKDLPFAAMFTAGTFFGTKMLHQLLQSPDDKRRTLLLYSLLYGMLLALITGVRIGGFLLLFFVPLAHALLRWTNLKEEGRRVWLSYILIGASWLVVMIAVQPASWSNPARWFFETVSYLSAHRWDGHILFAGTSTLPQFLPWYYIPWWLIISTPLLFLSAFATAIFWLPFRWKRFTEIQRVCAILVLLQIFFFPILAIIGKSTVYDEIRQFLLILPGIASLATVGLVWVYEKLPHSILRRISPLVLLFLLVPVISDMISLHPYEYCYFNRAFGGLKAAHTKYETDYWGLSMREGMEWIHQQTEEGLVVSSGRRPSSHTFAKPSFRLVLYEEFRNETESRPFYYIARPRWQLQQLFSECRIVFRVIRQEISLTIVKKCD